MTTPPTPQIDRDTQDGVVDDQSQATRSQLMGRERRRLGAAGARSSVTRTIGTPPAHGAVVGVNFVYSRRLRKFDTDLSFWGRNEDRVLTKRTSFLLFSCDTCCAPKREKEAGFEIESNEAG